MLKSMLSKCIKPAMHSKRKRNRISLPLSLARNIDIIYLGASIMNNSVKDTSSRGHIRGMFRAAGFNAEVYDHATQGWTTTDLLASINAGALDEYIPYAKRCFVFMHTAGNNISSDGPYPGGSSTIDNELRQIMDFLHLHGFQVMLSPTTYRIPPASNPSLPYNDNVIIPIIQEYTPWWIANDEPIFNMYKATFENQSWISEDGIHMSWDGKGELREYIVNSFLNNVTLKPVPQRGYIEDMVIAFRTGPIDIDGHVVYLNASNPTTTTIVNQDGSVVTNGSSISITNASENLSGRTISDNNSNSLRNSNIVKRGVYSSSPMFIDLSSAGIDPNANYVVKLTSSRDHTETTRISEFVIGGQTQEQLAIADPPLINAFGVSGTDLIASGITVKRKSGSPYCYINGLQIYKQ